MELFARIYNFHKIIQKMITISVMTYYHFFYLIQCLTLADNLF